MIISSNQEFVKKATLFFDSIVSMFAFYLAEYIKNTILPERFHNTVIREEFILTLIVIPIIYYLCASLLDIYHARYVRFFDILLNTLKNMIFVVISLLSFFFIFNIETMGRMIIFIYFILAMVFILISRHIVLAIFRYYIKRGLYRRNVVIVGSGFKVEEFVYGVERNEFWGIKILGLIDLESEEIQHAHYGYKVLGSIKEFKSILLHHPIDEVICAVPLSKLAHLQYIIETSEEIGITVRVISNFFNLVLAKSKMDDFDGIPVLTFSTTPSDLFKLYLKRFFDISFALINIILFSPTLFIIGLIIKLTSPGPVFFVQERCGLNGRRFNMLKFRTMVQNAEDLKMNLEGSNEVDGPVFKIKNDPRITLIGRILRKTSLDEMPQFINVLKGEMSIVGPRPPIPSEVEQYQMWQRRRLSMRPGLTCLWQVSGRNNISFDAWMRLDLKYIDNWSLWMDIKIILKTIPVVVFGKGAF